MKVLFVVTHLLGSGHLSRVLTLARAFAQQGHDATILSGGFPARHLDYSGISLVQLPPLRSDGTNFSRLLDADIQDAAPLYLQSRIQMALETLDALQPDALITELFPFGRKSLAPEFDAILHAATGMKQRPLILAPIRDILAPPRKPKKAERAEQNIAQFYDGILVRSDAATTPLELSWPVTPTIAQKLHYTGFVAPPLPAAGPSNLGEGEIIVSAGGGSVGVHLYEAALEAARRSEHQWRILIGGSDGAELSKSLQDIAPANAIVEPARADFRQLLQHAGCSVSLCGYNTALDVLQARCRAVFVPFDEGVEVEQGLRADSLSKRAEINTLKRSDLSAEALLAHVSELLAAARPEALDVEVEGANRSVEVVAQLLEQRRDV